MNLLLDTHAQALVEQMTLVSNDKEFDSYNVLRFW